jgi:hypothetical protein
VESSYCTGKLRLSDWALVAPTCIKMGAGASSMNRLRKALLMRAYNIRNSDETLEEQFRKHAYREVW